MHFISVDYLRVALYFCMFMICLWSKYVSIQILNPFPMLIEKKNWDIAVAILLNQTRIQSTRKAGQKNHLKKKIIVGQHYRSSIFFLLLNRFILLLIYQLLREHKICCNHVSKFFYSIVVAKVSWKGCCYFLPFYSIPF